ncbi:MAG: DUF1415 domain-containing protein [Gammaproteobacteria bacterium]|nr:DUF1415 domain-containing protein [Gammaproteobacteria bacterium]MDH5693189.1 DUF1415 domain-containing protein [Gammaproteobacteria bacterium]
MTDSANQNKIVLQTKAWLQGFVIKHSLCPFAAKPFKEDRIRYAVSAANNVDELVDYLIDEILKLKEADPEELETSLVIVPDMFNDFLDYNEFLDVADALIEELQVDGIIQIASFHPQYQFADLEQDDVRNYTNRSPYPMFHLIREDSIEKARGQMDVDAIPDRNMELLLELGLDGVRPTTVK